MPEQSIFNHAARVLDGITGERRADQALRDYLAAHRYLGPRDKGAITRAVFAYFRWLSWLSPKDSAQKRLEHAVELQARFNADFKTVKVEALAVRAVPAWLASEMELPADLLRQWQREPTLWLRARPGQREALAKSLFAAEPTPHARDALRFTGKQDLFRTQQFKDGEFEIQDLASQIVGETCAPKPGETWWDACAGEGGKTLHLADQMQNKGVVWATDRHTGRLETLKRRAARAKLFNYRTAVWDGSARLPTKTKFDGILVDAPCSGIGTWQRNPQARWTTTADDVRELAATQLALLNHVAGSVKPGGRLVYSVCTLTRSETTAVAEAFAAAHSEFEPSPIGLEGGGQRTEDGQEKSDPKPETLSDPSGQHSPSSARRPPSSVHLWPQAIDANGMFIAAWTRKKS
jgi:16S rRNA (cytosine967-C5)-methyltransferase